MNDEDSLNTSISYNNKNKSFESLNNFINVSTNEGAKNSLMHEPDFEYDEDYTSLLEENNVQTVINELNQDEDDVNEEHLSSSNIIDEDFETEIPMHNNELVQDGQDTYSAKMKNDAKLKINKYNIVNVPGIDYHGRPVITISACNLPSRSEFEKEFKSKQDFFDTLFSALQTTLDSYVESEYTIVYLHYGLKSESKPSFRWLLSIYRLLDRTYKKNLKALYIVHPSYFIKTVWQFFKPFISVKLSKKVTYCNTLDELNPFVDVKTLAIPDQVMQKDINDKKGSSMVSKTQVFKVSLKNLCDIQNGQNVPKILIDSIEFLKINALNEEGLFRKCGAAERIKYFKDVYNSGQTVEFAAEDIHNVASLLKLFFRELNEPLLTYDFYNHLLLIQSKSLATCDIVDEIRCFIIDKLPNENYYVLKYLIDFLSMVARNSEINKMNAKNLAIIFGPSILWVPINSLNEFSLTQVEYINNTVELLIRFHLEIFVKSNL